MRNQGALLLLLITAGSLIYASTGRPDHVPYREIQTKRPAAEAAVWLARGSGVTLARAGMETAPRFAADTKETRVERVLEHMMNDVPTGQDTNRFVCRLPAEVGPVPLLDAVDAYLRGLPNSHFDPVLQRDLHRAAQQGNWLAKVQLYLLRDSEQAQDDAAAVRMVTLMEWMQEQRIGALYAVASDALRSRTQAVDKPAQKLSSLDIYAAMHHDYPSQYRVGRALLRSGDTQQAAVGRRMLDCAARALPVYQEMFGSGELATVR